MILKNGITLSDALKEIAKHKEATKFLMGRYPYFKYSEYVDRMNSVLGADGYSVSYKAEQPLIFPNGQVMVVVSSRIDIFAKDGTIALTKTGIGSEEVDRNNDTGNYIGLNTCMLFAQQASFKSACKELDIFACVSKEKDSDDNNSGGSRNASGNGTNNRNETGTVMTFYVKKAVEVVKQDSNTHKNVYRLMGHECDGDRFKETESEIIFYPNNYGKSEDMMNAYVSKKTPFKVTLKVSPVKNKENAFVFKSFVGGK